MKYGMSLEELQHYKHQSW